MDNFSLSALPPLFSTNFVFLYWWWPRWFVIIAERSYRWWLVGARMMAFIKSKRFIVCTLAGTKKVQILHLPLEASLPFPVLLLLLHSILTQSIPPMLRLAEKEKWKLGAYMCGWWITNYAIPLLWFNERQEIPWQINVSIWTVWLVRYYIDWHREIDSGGTSWSLSTIIMMIGATL